MLRRLTTALVVSLVLCLPWLASAAQPGAPVPATKGRPLAELLNPDGAVNLTTGYSGTLDVAGFRMNTGPNGKPRFVADSTATTTSAPQSTLALPSLDHYWDARFAGSPGLNAAVIAVAMIGTELYSVSTLR